jgi:hypothetical protein
MAEAADRAARYLGALGKLNSSQGHDARALLGNLVLQVGLIEEMLKRSEGLDPDPRARLERTAAKASAAAREVHLAFERLLATTRPMGEEEARFDLRQTVRDAEAQLAPLLKAHRLAWGVRLPETPVMVEGRRDLAFQALVVALVAFAEAMPPASTAEVELGADGTLAISSGAVTPREPGPGEAVEVFGGEVRWDADRARPRATIHLPARSAARAE